MSFDDWYNSAEFGGLAIFQMVDQGIAEFVYNAGRAEQREADAVLVESNNVLLNYAICQSVVKMLAETIREGD